MEARILRRDKLLELVDDLIKDHEVIAPRDDLSYGRVRSASEVCLDLGQPAKSLKEFIFPDREVLLEFEKVEGQMRLSEPAASENTSRIIFGARPCDAAALPVLDKVFAWDYLDSSFLERRKQTAIVSVACEEPAKTCFCTSVAGSPAGTSGSDLVLTPMEDVYHVTIVTERGQALVEEHERFFEKSDQMHDRKRAQLEDEWIQKVSRVIELDEKGLEFEKPVWETITQQCIDCGVCTFLCPTCHCFDIQDEGNESRGERVRLWDSCAFYNFTKMPVGQPRPTHYRRYRQRIMHKFQYYPKNFGKILCVGCGRCIRYCPAGVDIRDVLQKVKE